jgi:drug/metabolite transporter (DMT)-like permease
MVGELANFSVTSFWYFWLTIQQQFHRSETYSVPLRYLFRFAPGALLLLLLRQLRIFAAAAARTPTPPRPLFGGREVPKKGKSPVASALALGQVCVGVGVVEVAVQCKNYTGEILVEKKAHSFGR